MWVKLLDFFHTAVSWIVNVLPTAFSVGMIVYGALTKRISLLKVKVAKLALELKYRDNEKRVEEANRGKSDLDIVRDAIREGGESETGNGDGDSKKG